MSVEGTVTSFEDVSAVMKKVSVEIAQKYVDRELDKAYREIQKKVSVRGFRQGKVPRSMLEKQYGEAVKTDAAKALAAHFLEHFVREKEIHPVAVPVIEEYKFEDGKGLTFTAKIEVRPEIDLEQYRGIEIAARPVSVSDDEVEVEVGRFRELHAQLHPVEGRETPQSGDIAYFEIAEVTGKGEAKHESHSLELGSGRANTVLEARLLGSRIGEPFEVDLPAGRNAKEGETKHFRVTVTGLKTKVLPELNDDFARDLGAYADLAALRSEVRSRIQKAKEQQAKTETEEELVREIIAKNPFPVPESLVERQLEAYLENIVAAVGAKNVNLDAARSEFAPRALFSVQKAMILDAVARREGMAIGEEDIEAEFRRLAKEQGKNTMWVRAQYEKDDALDGLRYALKERKVLAYLLGEAKMVEKEEGTRNT
ncbi:MAG: trigger factor [Deltaproteobacteria bacterium]|nr:trigger factor [Deltaproteobacteria bacterium]